MISHGLGDPWGGGMFMTNTLPSGVMIVKTGGGMILKDPALDGVMILKDHTYVLRAPSLCTARDPHVLPNFLDRAVRGAVCERQNRARSIGAPGPTVLIRGLRGAHVHPSRHEPPV